MTQSEERARERCKRHEGCRLTAYRDSLGNWTVGFGHRITDADRRRWGLDTQEIPDSFMITMEEAQELFDRDWTEARAGTIALCHSIGIEPLDEDPPPHDLRRFWALVEMTFQLGEAGLGRFRQMWGALGQGDYAGAALHALDSRWMEESPKRARTLAMILWRGI